ncbi:Asp-tRNA(Asn)/Glu-tRNA(Gln) amidotransferase subunit GatB [Patescibacteria group bacterium]|nr:Asp-tRNA(Asn)/Glu-tRNA(Gln) amidotransferase subunit GatB [Patescibacteria group bacterium]
MAYQPTIGLEIHVELNTKSKMFCSCPNDPEERNPNVNICPICLGHPGTLPTINQEAVKKVIKTGLALNCQIPEYSKFDRKNYFYPDLPKGYQISQYDMPFCKNGFLEINKKKVKIRRVHLEEDTGKLIHEKDYSLVDFNRAGIPLMELVTEPDLKSAKEARKFAEELKLILRYLNVSNADMEKGQLRVEANISLLRQIPNSKFQIPKKLGTKVEIKNLNSFRAVEKAIDYEIERQAKVLKAGKKVIQETRGWNEVSGATVGQREKEEAHDYRYFPEPDLPPLYSKKEEIEKIKAEIPELPELRRERFKEEYKLKDLEIEFFVQNKDLGEYFEKVVSEFGPRLPAEKISKLIKLAANYLITDLQGLLKGASVSGEGFLITPENFAEFIALIADGKISSKIAKIVLEEMFKTGADPSHIIEEKRLLLITDEVEIEKIVKKVISKNERAVKDFKKGKETALQFLIGQAIKETKGRANPKIVKEILVKTLDKLF